MDIKAIAQWSGTGPAILTREQRVSSKRRCNIFHRAFVCISSYLFFISYLVVRTDEQSKFMRKAVQHLKQSDPVLRAIMERVGAFKMNYDEPQFASLAEAIF